MKTQDPPADGFALPDAGISEAVRAAQQKLMELRRSFGIEPRGRDTKTEIRNTNEDIESAPYLVSRISYYSEPLSRHLRAAAARRQRQQAAVDRGWLDEMTNDKLRITNPDNRSPSPLLPFPPSGITNDKLRMTNEEHALNSSFVIRHSSLVKVYPDLALAMLRTKTAAAGRVWLLLRHFDAAGRGRVAVGDAARLLTGDGSSGRICGRRQLGNLLRAGEGLFWQRDTGRDGAEWLRLHSAARAAAALGVRRLAGSPVAVPLNALTGTIGQARAHLYASFHSGRTRAGLLTGERQARGPISRATLCKLSGAAANSQRNYERRARVGRRSAIAIGPRVSAADEQETAWRRGRAMFRFRDDKGRHGRPGAVYLAWQLPNEYTGPHDTLPRGRMKRLNRALADLFHDGMTGNSGRAEWQVACGRWQVAGGRWQYPVTSGSVNSEQWSVTSEESAAGGRWSAVGHPHRQFYATAKAAFGARHPGERYWRLGDVWLWQPELRVTSDELRVQTARRYPFPDDKSNGDLFRPTELCCSIDPLDTVHLPPATCHPQHSERVISSDDRSRHS